MGASRKRRLPQRGTVAKKVALALFEHGKPVTIEEGIAIHGETGLVSKYPMQGIYNDMVANGYLMRSGNLYSLNEYVRKHYCDMNGKEFNPLPVVQKRTNHSKGEMPVQKRDPRIRADIFYKTVGGV